MTEAHRGESGLRSSDSSRSCAPAPCGRRASRGAVRRPSAMSATRADCRRDEQPLLAPGEADQHRVVEAGREATASTFAVVVVTVEPMQMNGGRAHLAARKPPVVRPRCPPAECASPEPLSRNAHSSSGSWLPPTIAGVGGHDSRRPRHPAGSQRSRVGLAGTATCPSPWCRARRRSRRARRACAP